MNCLNIDTAHDWAEGFGMVDALIKIGVDSEAGNQIVNATRDLEPKTRQAVVAAVSLLTDNRPFIDAAQRMTAYNTLCNELSNLNTMRGGVKGFKGFVAEHMQAADYTAAGRFTRVVDDNGPIDLIFAGKNGRKYPYQVKIGYKPGRIDFAKYKGQTVIVDKGNPYLSEFQAEGARHGVKVVEGTVTEKDVKRWADAMQFETRTTGGKTSVIVPESQRVLNNLSAMHEAGLKVGKTGAMYGAGFSIGGNIIDMMRGKVTASATRRARSALRSCELRRAKRLRRLWHLLWRRLKARRSVQLFSVQRRQSKARL